VSLLVLWVLWKVGRAVWVSIRAPRGGWSIDVVESEDGEHWKQGIWVRKGPGFFRRIGNGLGRLVRSRDLVKEGNDPDVLVVEERRPLLG
jgi:hypothetical protein